jgi:hypothetical protein
MRLRARLLAAVGVICLLAMGAGCGGGSTGGHRDPDGSADPAEPTFEESQFVLEVTNPYFPLVPGTLNVYEGEGDDGFERIEEFVSHVTRTVAGVECVVVVDRAYENGELVEETFDWYAQDSVGNVWYMGEDSREMEDGDVISTEGSWEAGVDGAVPGIIMKASFVIGDTYRQEYYEGEAEDMGEIVARDVAVTLEGGQSFTCVQIRDTTPLEPDVEEFKYYAPGVGLVVEETPDGTVRIERIETEVDTMPDIDPLDFVLVIDNPYFTFTPGMTKTYSGDTEDGEEVIEITVRHATKTVMGVVCTVVEDLVYVDGELVEETDDWYAQDVDGNVWYFGEDSKEIEDGAVVSTEGSWEAGVDGAQPGIVMPADPRVGDTYRQEYYEGEAEDMAEIVGLEVSVTLSDGRSFSCLKVHEWNPFEADSHEYKYYTPGAGLVLESGVDGSEAIELEP